MKSDILFTTWNCENCSYIKTKINPDAIYEDDFFGKSGQTLSLLNAFSNSGTKKILEKFEFPDHVVTPALYTYDGTMIWEIKDLEAYLKEQGFLNAEKT